MGSSCFGLGYSQMRNGGQGVDVRDVDAPGIKTPGLSAEVGTHFVRVRHHSHGWHAACGEARLLGALYDVARPRLGQFDQCGVRPSSLCPLVCAGHQRRHGNWLRHAAFQLWHAVRRRGYRRTRAKHARSPGLFLHPEERADLRNLVYE